MLLLLPNVPEAIAGERRVCDQKLIMMILRIVSSYSLTANDAAADAASSSRTGSSSTYKQT
jgi:hypothetical protein